MIEIKPYRGGAVGRTGVETDQLREIKMECTCATVIIAGGLVVKTLRDPRCPEHGDDARAQEVVNAFKTLAEMGKRETKMEETKHTPGEWRWEARNEKENDEGLFVALSGTKDDVFIATADADGNPFVMVNRANARLVVAAPELLAELENCVEVLKRVRDDEDEGQIAEQIKDPLAVIAKAKGRQS